MDNPGTSSSLKEDAFSDHTDDKINAEDVIASGGYSYELVDDTLKEIKELECPICCLLMRDAQQLSCHHAMCLSCLEKWEKENIQKNSSFTCPQCCRVIVKEKTVPNGIINRLITTSIKVKCGNVGKGCQWVGVISDIEIHMNDKCEFILVICINERCGQKLERRLMGAHVVECCFRIIFCSYCRLQLAYLDQEEHFKECEDFPVKCSSDACPLQLPRKQINDHLVNGCEMTMVECKYSSVGCDFKNLRKDVQKHYDNSTSRHMDMMFSELQETKQKMIETSNELQETKKKMDQTSNELQETKKKMDETSNQLQETKKKMADMSAKKKDVNKIFWVSFEDIVEKSTFFKALNAASIKAQEMKDDLQIVIDDAEYHFDQWSLLKGALNDLNDYITNKVEVHNNKLHSLRIDFFWIDLVEVKKELVGNDILLAKDDEDYLYRKVRKFHEEKMEKMEDFWYRKANYEEKFNSLLNSIQFDQGYKFEEHLFMKIDVSEIEDTVIEDTEIEDTAYQWTLDIYSGEYDSLVDSDENVLKVTLDKLYYSAAIVSPNSCKVDRLPFNRRFRDLKEFYLDTDTLSDSSTSDCVALFRFTNNRN